MHAIVAEIEGGDYQGAGKGSKDIKEILRKVGVDANTIRRAIIAVYEGEMNVAIHAYNGVLRAAITPDALEVIITDTGPGIPDIEQAMREGFSTAPPEARELGFGAGMGLPNIRRNTDRFSLDSTPGKGTTLHFSVFLEPGVLERVNASAITIKQEKCIKCLRCLNACPTQAIRIRAEGPEILRHLCIDCTVCMDVCPQGVFDMDCADDPPPAPGSGILIAPDALFGQFGPAIPRSAVREQLQELGWHEHLYIQHAETALFQAASEFALNEKTAGLGFIPVCPAVLNLIQLRYPSLIPYVLPFLSPMESIRDRLLTGLAVFVPSCPAQSALVRDCGILSPSTRLHPRNLAKSLLPRLQWSRTGTVSDDNVSEPPPCLIITGMRRVCQFLDKAERGLTEDCVLTALYACENGCYGSPVWETPPAVAMFRAKSGGGIIRDERLSPLYRIKPLVPRAGVRLDTDMVKAMKKLREIDRSCKQLPGRDCGVCGAPTCMTLAEDAVMGRAVLDACIFRNNSPGHESGAAKETDR